MIKEITEGNNREPKRLVMSKQNFSLWEKKLIYHIINRIDAKIGLKWDLFKNMEIVIPTKGNIDNQEFNSIKKAVRSLADKRYIYTDSKKQEIEVIHPYPRVSYKSGQITILILGEVVPELAELAGGYSNYLVEDALSLQSTYSQRLFEILSFKKNFNDGKWVTDLDELRNILNCSDKYVAKHAMFYERIIESSIAEINTKTRLKVKLSAYDKSKAVTIIAKDATPPKELTSLMQSIDDKNLNEKQLRCKKYLDKIGIIRVDIISKILFDENMQSQFWKWWSVNQASYSEFRNPAGVLLKHLSIKS